MDDADNPLDPVVMLHRQTQACLVSGSTMTVDPIILMKLFNQLEVANRAVIELDETNTQLSEKNEAMQEEINDLREENQDLAEACEGIKDLQ